MLRIFTIEELKEFNGKNGKSAYIGYNGKVYDVTESFHWKNGNHWVIHEAGSDLSQEMADAPHFDDVMGPFTIVGILKAPARSLFH